MAAKNPPAFPAFPLPSPAPPLGRKVAKVCKVYFMRRTDFSDNYFVFHRCPDDLRCHILVKLPAQLLSHPSPPPSLLLLFVWKIEAGQENHSQLVLSQLELIHASVNVSAFWQHHSGSFNVFINFP